MAKKKVKTVNIDAMFKAFIKTYDLSTRQDIEKLSAKIDRLEKLMKQTSGKTIKAAGGKDKDVLDKSEMTASGAVLKVIRNSRQGADFARIQAKTGFEDKKLRNIIFRLNKIGKIARKSRGIYVVTA
jgi:Fic family protein